MTSIFTKIVSCEIHDIVRELCLKIVEKEEFLCVVDAPGAIDREHRVVIRGSTSFEMHESFNDLRSTVLTRSLTCSCRWSHRGLKFLRVLNKVEGSFMESDFHQVNLPYLDCYIFEGLGPQPFYLSPSISLLWSLQTLIVVPSPSSFIAPDEFWEMLQLRHLEITEIHLPNPLPSDGDRLVLANLQTLLHVKNFRLSEEVCKRVSNIKKLRVEYTDWGLEYCLHNLGRLHKLESFSCTFSEDPEWCDVARSFTFLSSLKELSLTGSRLQWEELSMMVGSLPLLEVVNLDSNAVVGSEWNAVEGEFIRLKSLTVFSCHDLVNFNADSSHFPGLIDLDLLDLPKLDELPSSMGEMASLHRISLRGGCSVSLALSAMRMLVEQEQEFGNEELQLEVCFGKVA